MRRIGGLSASLFVRTRSNPASIACPIDSYFNARAIPRPRTARDVPVKIVHGTPRTTGQSRTEQPTIASPSRAIQKFSSRTPGFSNENRIQSANVRTRQGTVVWLAFVAQLTVTYGVCDSVL